MKKKKPDIANETLGKIPKYFIFLGIVISVFTIIILIFSFKLLFF